VTVSAVERAWLRACWRRPPERAAPEREREELPDRADDPDFAFD